MNSPSPVTPVTGSTLPPSSGDAGGARASAKPGLTATARDAASHLKSAATDTVARAREEAQRVASEKKSTAADRIGNYSSAIHESAKSLEEKDPNIAWFTHRAADRLDQVADYVRNRDFTNVRRDAEDIARRHPALFFGGLFVAGLVLGNVLKASRSTRRSYDEETDYTDDSATSDWAATSSTTPDPAPSSGL